jgi:predicted nucleotide-binding protein (sugar kinase/HSP70/actin superfamily)
MKITFPHFGNVYIAVKTLFDGLGVDYVIPPFSSSTALEIGSKYSPEEMCLPFKIMMGNYIQSIELGADTVIIFGSCGPCRFGEYGELQMRLLKKLGHEVEFIVIDVPRDVGVGELLRRIGRITSDSRKSRAEKIKITMDALKVMKLIDEIENKVRYLSGFEKNTGECKTLLQSCKKEVLLCNNTKETLQLLNYYKNKVHNLEINKNKKPLKIALIGEIYTIIEPFSNLYIENKLMEYGVSTKKTLTPSWWVKDMALSAFNINSINIRRAAKEYLPLCVGGHAVECVGEAVLASEEGFDGAIQIFPLGCMPEIVSKAILPTISARKNFPILTLVVDEMTGETGYITRIEAFLDLLERRR